MSAKAPALPGQRVVAYIASLGMLRGTLHTLHYDTYLAAVWVDKIADRPLHADLADIALEQTYDAMLAEGWQLDPLYYQLKQPGTGTLLTLASAAAQFERAKIEP